MTGWATYVYYARQLDADAGIDPWAFAASNPGFVWLKEKFSSAVESDADGGGTLSESFSSAGHSMSETHGMSALLLAQILNKAIEKYMAGHRGGTQPKGSRSDFRGMIR
jgi:hypothetical protein